MGALFCLCTFTIRIYQKVAGDRYSLVERTHDMLSLSLSLSLKLFATEPSKTLTILHMAPHPSWPRMAYLTSSPVSNVAHPRIGGLGLALLSVASHHITSHRWGRRRCQNMVAGKNRC